MTSALKNYFPLIRDREDILREIKDSDRLSAVFHGWNPQQQDEFLDFCTGNHGLKILHDSFIKEVLNPEYDPSRLEFLLSVLLGRKVKILQILANDTTRIASETSLLVTDVIVQLEDGSLANIEMQRVGYAFPGARCACYSSDMLLRQYRRLCDESKTSSPYGQIKNVYLIVIFEHSPKQFKMLPDIYFHHARQVFDTGLDIDLLQEYILIPLDIFHKHIQNKSIEIPLDAWLTFFSDDTPERIIELITKYPEFKAMYNTIYKLCCNTERVMEMFSEELRQMDRETVRYMIEEQQKELEENQKALEANQRALEENRKALDENQKALDENQKALAQRQKALEEKDQEIAALRAQLEALKKGIR